MAKKTKQITQAGATEILPGQQNPTIILQSPELFHFDIGKYMAALETAEAIDFHNRTQLYDIFHSIITTDGHLSGIVDKRLSAVSRERFEFQRDGKPVDEVNRQIRSPWFRAWVKDAVASKLWGFSLFQFRIYNIPCKCRNYSLCGKDTEEKYNKRNYGNAKGLP